jgi:hypothetical protein
MVVQSPFPFTCFFVLHSVVAGSLKCHVSIRLKQDLKKKKIKKEKEKEKRKEKKKVYDMTNGMVRETF